MMRFSNTQELCLIAKELLTNHSAIGHVSTIKLLDMSVNRIGAYCILIIQLQSEYQTRTFCVKISKSEPLVIRTTLDHSKSWLFWYSYFFHKIKHNFVSRWHLPSWATPKATSCPTLRPVRRRYKRQVLPSRSSHTWEVDQKVLLKSSGPTVAWQEWADTLMLSHQV